MATLSELEQVRGAQRGGFRVLGEAVWITQGSLLHRAPVDVASVQPVSALATRFLATGFRGLRSCGPEFGRPSPPGHSVGEDAQDLAQQAMAWPSG